MDLEKDSRIWGLALGLAVGLSLSVTGTALATTPGWECVPTTAGQAVVSGGTGAAPSCGAGTTAVLAPTYVSSGVGGKPTVQLSAVNLQIINGSGTETTINGEGNLIVGYDEKPGTQTGSHDLLLGGTGNSYTSYGGMVGGASNDAISGPYASILGGAGNIASGFASAIAGGRVNKASTEYSAVSGGCSNLAGTGTLTVNSNCTTVDSGYYASVAGGAGNQASAENSAVSGGYKNLASGVYASVLGGIGNKASGSSASVLGGESNQAITETSSISGGNENMADGSHGASVVGGFHNVSSGSSSTISGGVGNVTEGANSFVGGGTENYVAVGGEDAAIAGGQFNEASAFGAFIGGGKSIFGTANNGTYGLISDGLNVGQDGSYAISLTLNAGQCSNVAYGVPAAQVGDLPLVAYDTNPPAGLVLSPTGVTTAGQVNVETCNVGTTTLKLTNVKIRVQTFR